MPSPSVVPEHTAAWRSIFESSPLGTTFDAVLAAIDDGLRAGALTASMAAVLRAEQLATRARTAEVDALLASVDDEEARAWDAWLAGRLADLRAHAAKRAGSAELALALTEQGLARAPEHSRLAVLQQELLFDLGRRTRAEVEAALGALHERAPSDLVLLGALAEARFLAKDFEGTARYAQKVLALAPGDTYGLYLIGKARFFQGRDAEACELLEQAVQANPACEERLELLVHAYAFRNDAQGLLRTCRLAAPLFPSNAVFHKFLAHALLVTAPHERTEALTHARAAVALHPEDATLEVLLAFCLANAGAWRECADLARRLRAHGVPHTTFNFLLLEMQIQQHLPNEYP